MDCRRLGSGERTVGADLLRDQLAGTLQELASKQAIKTAAAKLQVPKLFRTLPGQRKGKQQHQKLTPLFVQPRSSCCPETFETVSPHPQHGISVPRPPESPRRSGLVTLLRWGHPRS